jgi:hypothetical protein
VTAIVEIASNRAAVAPGSPRHCIGRARADNPTRNRYSSPITVVFGVMLGVLVSLCSVGAGALGVAVLFFLYPWLPPVRIVGVPGRPKQ